jgi:hypothetical protein
MSVLWSFLSMSCTVYRDQASGSDVKDISAAEMHRRQFDISYSELHTTNSRSKYEIKDFEDRPER